MMRRTSRFAPRKTYLAVAVIGGLVTLMGLFMMYQKAGTLNMAELTAFMQSRENPAEFYAIGVLILFGFAAKAGLFPLHIWLPNAYTVAPAPSSALLSCLLTKNRRIWYDYRQLQAFPA